MDLTGYDNMLDSIKTKADEIDRISLENDFISGTTLRRPATEHLETSLDKSKPFVFFNWWYLVGYGKS